MVTWRKRGGGLRSRFIFRTDYGRGGELRGKNGIRRGRDMAAIDAMAT